MFSPRSFICSSTIFNVSFTLAGLVLGLHCLLLWASPFVSIYPTMPAISMLVLFFLLFFVSSKFVLIVGVRSGVMRISNRVVSLAQVFADPRLQCFLVAVSLVGLGLHVWSKYHLTQLRPINCISEIRFAWMEVDRQLLPLSIKIGSVLGHLLTSFAYLGIMAASFNIGRAAELKSIKRKDLAQQLLFTMVAVLYAGFIGSRNAMLAFLAMSLVGVMMALVSSSLRKDGNRSCALHVTGLVLPLVSAIVFSSVIFSDRLFCRVSGTLDKQNITEQSITEQKTAKHGMTGYYREFSLAHRSEDGDSDFRDILFTDQCSICSPAMVYVNHGIFNLSKVLANEARGDPVLLRFFSSLPKRLGLAATPPEVEASQRVYGPGGLSLAGAAYHDFGNVGVVVTAVVLGLLFGQSILWLESTGIRLLVGVWLFSCLFYVLLISNMFVGFSVLPFPFIAFGIGTGLIVWYVGRSLGVMHQGDESSNHHPSGHEHKP